MSELREALLEVLKSRIEVRKAQAYDIIHERAIELIAEAKNKGLSFAMNHIEDNLADGFHRLAGRFGYRVTKEQDAANRQMIAAKEAYALSHPDHKLPENVDWRVAGGEVLHQGQCGSCVPVSVIAAVSAKINIVLNDDAADVFGNINELFTNCGGRCNVGMHPEDALRYLRDVGVGYEHQAPYVDRDINAYRLAPKVKISSYKVLHGEQEMKQALQKGPILVGMSVWDSIYNYTSGLFTEGLGREIGPHCAMCVGYTPSAMIIQQPWGTGFGMNGFMEYSWQSSITKVHPAYSIEILPADLPPEVRGLVNINNPPVAQSPSTPAGAIVVEDTDGTRLPDTAKLAFVVSRFALQELIDRGSPGSAVRVARLLYKLFG